MSKSKGAQLLRAIIPAKLRQRVGRVLAIVSNRLPVEEIAIQNAFNAALWRLNFPRKVVKQLHNILAGKELLVLGSAPNPALPPNADSMEVICVNGSAAIAKEFNLKTPLITIVDREVLKFREIGEKRHQEFQNLRDGEVGTLVAVSSNDCELATESLQFLDYATFVDLRRGQRIAILRRASCSPVFDKSHGSLASSGAFAVALVSLSRPKKVWVAGIRLSVPIASKETPHHYQLDSMRPTVHPGLTQTVGRNHSRADAALIACLSIAGHPIDSTENEIQALCSNWRG